MWGVTAKAFREALNSVSTPTIKLNINSPGGDVFDGIAIFSDLVDHQATVDVRVTGLAASAASLIAMAGDTVTIAEHAFFMIHNAWTFSIGNKAQLQKDAQVLAKIDEQLADRYAQRTGQDIGDIVDMMDNETWINANEAVDLGFADEVSASEDGGEKARASFDLSDFKNVPRALKASRTSAKTKAGKKPAADPSQRPAEDFSSLAAALEKLNATIAA
jgi:ATP-dependent protease ClpP protease subunit